MMTKLSCVLFLVAAFLLAQSYTQSTARTYNTRRTTARPGAYVNKDNSGRYRPDDRGKYKHVSIAPVPYEHVTIPPLPPGDYQYKGGYQYKGDYQNKGTGLPYQNKYFPTTQLPPKNTKATAKPKPPVNQNIKSLNLGPKDHLRFMLDFNFNDGGWQIVQFDWNRDDENGFAKPKYNYVNERKVFDVPAKKLESHLNGYFYSSGPNDRVHLDGQLNKGIASFNFTESNPGVRIADNTNVRETIGEVLDYVKKFILPKLN